MLGTPVIASVFHFEYYCGKEEPMTTAANQLLTALLQLSPIERGEIASQLLISLDPASDEDIDAAWSEEIRTRVADIRSGAVKGVPWRDAREQILADDDGGS